MNRQNTGEYIFYYYSGTFSLGKYYVLTFLVSTALVLLLIPGTLLMLRHDEALYLIITLVIFSVSFAGYVVYINYRVKALYSVFALDKDNSLWLITVQPSRSMDAFGSSVPDARSAITAASHTDYIAGVIEDVKAGNDRFSIWSGGDQYTKLEEYRIVKETKNFISVEAVMTTRRHTAVKKTKRYVKFFTRLHYPDETVSSMIRTPRPREPFERR